MIGASEVILFLFIPVLVLLIVLWLWMLIDCLKRRDDMFKFGGNNARLIWILVIILTGVIGAVIYYFLIKKTDSHEDRIIGIALLASLAIIVILIASGLMVNTRSTVSIEPYPPGKLPQSIEIPTISLTPKVTPVLPPINQTLPSNATTIPATMQFNPIPVLSEQKLFSLVQVSLPETITSPLDWNLRTAPGHLKSVTLTTLYPVTAKLLNS